jgi:hypothetical protein
VLFKDPQPALHLGGVLRIEFDCRISGSERGGGTGKKREVDRQAPYGEGGAARKHHGTDLQSGAGFRVGTLSYTRWAGRASTSPV